jgi:hypothetical protein
MGESVAYHCGFPELVVVPMQSLYRPQISGFVILEWALLSTVGLAGGMVITLLAIWIFSFLSEAFSQRLAASAILLPVMGLSQGFFQWLLLRRVFNKISGWILATLLGWAIGFPLGFILFQYINNLTGGELSGGLAGILQISLFGLVIGILQWWVLTKQIRLAGWWVLASIVGWNAGFALGGPGELIMGAQLYLTGVIYGLISGGVLFVVLRMQPQETEKASPDQNPST